MAMSALLKKKLLLLAGVISLFGAVAAGVRWIPDMVRAGPVTFRLDISAPDALLLSHNLSQLPRDLLQVPVLRDTLTEELVFYYEQHEDRLSLSGTLKRLAFEHELSFSDEVVGSLLQQPAEIALWKGPGGKLEHWLLAVRRDGLTRLTEAALKLAGKDEQLQKAGVLELEGDELPVYVLHYGRERQLYFAARGERLLAATDIQLLLGSADEDGEQKQRRHSLLSDLFKPDPAANPFVRQFRLQAGDRQLPAARHSLTLTTRYLSFGYGQLFRGVNALRFDFGEGGWSSWGQLDATRVTPAQLNANALWKLAPTGAALCASAPMDWPALTPTIASLTDDASQSERFTASLQPPVAVCWYPAGHYYAPLLLVGGNAAAWPDAWLQQMFDAFVGSSADVAATSRAAGQARLWQKALETRVTLARTGSVLAFSTDEKLVQQVLKVADKRYPALADSLPPQAALALYVHPRELARLLRQDVMATLPQDNEPVFFEAASRHLLPRLKALERFAPFALTYPARLQSATGWEPLQWTELRR